MKTDENVDITDIPPNLTLTDEERETIVSTLPPKKKRNDAGAKFSLNDLKLKAYELSENNIKLSKSALAKAMDLSYNCFSARCQDLQVWKLLETYSLTEEWLLSYQSSEQFISSSYGWEPTPVTASMLTNNPTIIKEPFANPINISHGNTRLPRNYTQSRPSGFYGRGGRW